jgi:hypothetical protein
MRIGIREKQDSAGRLPGYFGFRAMILPRPT